MELYIESRQHDNAHIIDVQGDIDLYSSPMMRDYVFRVIKQERPAVLILNLSRVNYTDSSGIATLVEGLQLSGEYHTQFKLVGLSHSVLEVFQLARLERVFNIYENEDDALQDQA